ARGAVAEPGHEPRPLAGRVAQGIEHAVDMPHRPRSALHRKTHRFIDHQNVGVLVQRDRAQKLPGFGIAALPLARSWRLEAQRRNAHRLPGLEAILRLDPASVHPELAFSDHALNVREREPGKPRLEKSADAPPGVVRPYR